MKPEVVLEFELWDTVFMRPAPMPTTSGALPPKDTLTLRDRTSRQTIALYAVLDGVRVVPIAITPDTQVDVVVSR